VFHGAQGRCASADAILTLGSTSAANPPSVGAGATESVAAPGPLLFPTHWQGLADMEAAALRAQLALASREWDAVHEPASSALTLCEVALRPCLHTAERFGHDLAVPAADNVLHVA
jgi:hypothetical protein